MTTLSKHYFQWWKTESISSKIRIKTKVPTLAIIMQHSFGGLDLTEAEDVDKNTHKLNDPDNHDGVIPQLESDILECKVKWALGSITMNKANGDKGISAELF